MIKSIDINDLRSIRMRPKNKGPYIWEPFMRKYDCQVICEVGVGKGVNFQEMIRHKPKIAIAIDSWIDDGIISRNDVGYSQEVLDNQFLAFIQSVADKTFVKVYREYSFDAVKHFEDDYFDLVYIDADHSYEGCLRDINDWYPKVKKSCFLLGDDYRIYEGRRAGVSFGVIKATKEFASKNNLKLIELPSYGWVIIKR